MKKKVIALTFITLATYQIGYLLWLNAYEAPFFAWNLSSLILTILLSLCVLLSGIHLLVNKEKKID